MRVLIILLLALVLGSCTSGRKAYLRGQYDEATLKSVNRLRSDPGNSKAKTTLRQAYHQAVNRHQTAIATLAHSHNIYKWEEIADHYKQLGYLAEQIRTCPACLMLIPAPNAFAAEREEARTKAAEVRYEAGKRALERRNDRQAGREAYGHFAIAELYFPGFRDVRTLREQAKHQATLQVLIERIPVQAQALRLNTEFFENKIREFARQNNRNEFVRFLSPEELRSNPNLEPDHVLVLSFDQFMIGQTHVQDSETQLQRDSVVVGTVVVEGVTHNVYNTVRARLRVFNKKVISSGLLDLRILDARNHAVLSQEKLPGTYIWETSWATFNGDERALSPEQLRLCRQREAMPPPPQDLFVAFTQPIFGQVTAKIRDFYQRY